VTPAWRLPRGVRGVESSRSFLCEALLREYGVACAALWELGGRYHPSPGLTPEVVSPFAVEVRCVEPNAPSPLRFVPLDEVVQERHTLRDGHLRIVAMRAAHALGRLAPATFGGTGR
jgi:hypothetical protein